MICLQTSDVPTFISLDTLGRLLGQWESLAENAHFIVTRRGYKEVSQGQGGSPLPCRWQSMMMIQSAESNSALNSVSITY